MRNLNLPRLFLFSLLFLVFSPAGFTQSAGKAVKKLTKAFEKAYNSKDQAAITAMFTENAVRVDANGVTTTGAAQISEIYAQSFTNTDTKVVITHLGVKDDDGTKATAKGSYALSGATKSGEKVAIAGTYENTIVKDNGKWKISHMKLMDAK